MSATPAQPSVWGVFRLWQFDALPDQNPRSAGSRLPRRPGRRSLSGKVDEIVGRSCPHDASVTVPSRQDALCRDGSLRGGVASIVIDKSSSQETQRHHSLSGLSYISNLGVPKIEEKRRI